MLHKSFCFQIISAGVLLLAGLCGQCAQADRTALSERTALDRYVHAPE